MKKIIVKTIDTSDVQWEVAHLFEHLIIDGYRSYLDERGYGRTVFGWLIGETFEKRLFLEGGFYSSKTADMFEDYLKNVKEFSDHAIKEQITTLEAENKSSIEIADSRQLHRCMKILTKRLTTDNALAKPRVRMEDPIKQTASAKSFRDISTKLIFTDLNDVEVKLLLRFKAVLLDILMDCINFYGGYERGVSDLARRESASEYGLLQISTFKRGLYTSQELTNKIQDFIIKYDYEKYFDLIKKHFEEYAKEPLWKTFTIDYYRTTNVLITPEDVASALTLEYIHSLISKLIITCSPATSEEYGYLV